MLRNIDDQSYLDPKVETKQYKMKDINFVIDGIHDRSKKTVSTYIKFGEGYQVDVKGSSSKFNNLAFGTLIKAKSAAQGGNAPIELVIGLMKKNGSDIKFKNDFITKEIKENILNGISFDEAVDTLTGNKEDFSFPHESDENDDSLQ